MLSKAIISKIVYTITMCVQNWGFMLYCTVLSWDYCCV